MVIVVSLVSGLYWRGSALVNVRTEGSHGPRGAHPEAGGHRGDRAPQVPLLALPRSEALGRARRLLHGPGDRRLRRGALPLRRRGGHPALPPRVTRAGVGLGHRPPRPSSRDRAHERHGGARHVGALQLPLQPGAEALGADRRLLPRRVREGGGRLEDRAHRLHVRLPRGVEPGGHAEPPAGRDVSYGSPPKYASSTRMYGTQWRRCFTSSRAASSERPSRAWRYAIAAVGARFKPALQCT